MLTLSLHIKPGKRRLDIQVNDNQTILETMTVLEDKGLLPGMTLSVRLPVRSERSRERINPQLTYAQAEIYTGDILHVGEEESHDGYFSIVSSDTQNQQSGQPA